MQVGDGVSRVGDALPGAIVGGMGLAQRERAALADFLQAAGPDRPTLCEGWTTGDLLAHLLIRERRPDSAIGMLVPPLAGHAERIRREIRSRPWAEQIGLLRAGPPWWNPMGWGRLDELANGGEMFIHHEDARRGEAGWQPRDLDPQTTAAVTEQLSSPAIRFRLRRSPVGITAVLPGRPPLVLHAGSPVAELHADPAEVLLWIAGRSAVRIAWRGDPDAVRAAQALSRRM
jgi:uncharacterized protein (TIGR03085 family)